MNHAAKRKSIGHNPNQLALRDRGLRNPAKHKGGRGKQNLTQMRVRPSVLTEPFFGSNPSDCAVEHKHTQAFAQAQLEANVLLSQPIERLWEVTASKLNVRGGPSTGFEKLDWGQLKKGADVEVISWEGDWAQIETPKGDGYVFGSYLT